MARLSVIILTKNEEANIEGCINSVSWADEILVYDSGSTDKTLEIASKYTKNINVDTDWQGFGVHRQRAQQHVNGDWILMLDADERVSPILAEKIQKIVSENNQQYVFAIPRLSFVFGRFIRHSGWYPDYVIRLYPRDKAEFNSSRVHEKLENIQNLQVIKLSGDLLHYTYRDLEHYLVKSAHYAAEWARQREGRGKRGSLLQGLLHGIGCFIKMYLLRAGFLDGKQGFLIAVLSAHSTFAKYADLWVRQQSNRS